MHQLFSRLSNYIRTEKTESTEYYIAKVMLEHIETLSDYSINEIAELCNVSKSKISKFVRKLGFEDFLDFKWSGELEEGRLYYTKDQSTINITDYLCKNGVKQYLDVLSKDIELLFEKADISQIDEFVSYLHDYKKIAAFGMGYSEAAASNLSYKMMFYHKYVFTTSVFQEQIKYIKQADKETLLIIFSNRGGYLLGKPEGILVDDKIDFTKCEAKTVLITSNKKMARQPGIDLCIHMNYSDRVQNHPVLYQLLIEQIAFRYQQVYGLPDKN